MVCRDQATGKIHWRRKLRGQAWSRATPLVADGKVFIPRVSSPRYAMIVDQPDLLVCLDQASEELLWERTIGRSDWLRAPPVFAWRDRQSSTRETMFLRTGFRVSDPSLTTDRSKPFAIVCGPLDELAVYIDGDQVLQTQGWQGGAVPQAADDVGVAARVVPLDFELEPGEHRLAIGVRRAGVKSNVSGSSSVFPPRLISGNLGPMAGLTGPLIEAWDASTGEPRWTYSISPVAVTPAPRS